MRTIDVGFAIVDTDGDSHFMVGRLTGEFERTPTIGESVTIGTEGGTTALAVRDVLWTEAGEPYLLLQDATPDEEPFLDLASATAEGFVESLDPARLKLV